MIWCPRGSTPAPHRSKSEEWQRPAAVLDPHHWDATTDLTRAATQTWALRSEGRIILIDTGAGNGEYRPLQPIWSYLDADYLDNLAAALARDFRRDRRDAGIPRVARPCRSCEPGRHGRDRRRDRHRQRLDPVRDAGATDVVLSPLGTLADRTRTLDLVDTSSLILMAGTSNPVSSCIRCRAGAMAAARYGGRPWGLCCSSEVSLLGRARGATATLVTMATATPASVQAGSDTGTWSVAGMQRLNVRGGVGVAH